MVDSHFNPLVIIPARKGSKGVPNKNKRHLNGKPLIQYTIDAALEVFKPESICVSTDDPEIAEIARQSKIPVPFLRPPHLASDTASSRDVVLHALDYYKLNEFSADGVVLLQPTSPFRTGVHINEVLELFSTEMDMIVSVKESKDSPYFSLFEENKAGQLIRSKDSTYTRRQDAPKVYSFNGAVYVFHAKSIRASLFSEFPIIKKYVMDQICSHDIDTEFDWRIAEMLAS